MDSLKYLFLLIYLMYGKPLLAQNEFSSVFNKPTAVPELTIEPGIGIHTNFGTDFLLTNLIQWNPMGRLSMASHSSFNINNITQRYFNGIKTNYNYSINQKFGIGTSFFTRSRSHTFMFMFGAKYTTYRETLDDERFDKAGTSIQALSPDYGLMYSQKNVGKKYFFTYRVYVPLYPWPAKGSDILYLESNMENIALEAGIGIRIF